MGVQRRGQLTAPDQIQPGVPPSPGQAHVDPFPRRGVGAQVAPGLVGLALGHVAGHGVGMGNGAHHPGADCSGEILLAQCHPPPALEVDHHYRVLARADLDHLAPLTVAHKLAGAGVLGAQPAVLLHGHHLVAGLEALAGQLQHRSGQGAVAGEEGPGPGVELPALHVVVGHHRRGGHLGIGPAVDAVHVPVGHQGVQQFLGRIRLHDAPVSAQALQRLGDAPGGVVDRGQADLVHLRGFLAPAEAQLGSVLGVVLQQRPPGAAGSHRRVLGGVSHQAQGRSGALHVGGQTGQVPVAQGGGLVHHHHAALVQGHQLVVQAVEEAGHGGAIHAGGVAQHLGGRALDHGAEGAVAGVLPGPGGGGQGEGLARARRAQHALDATPAGAHRAHHGHLVGAQLGAAG